MRILLSIMDDADEPKVPIRMHLLKVFCDLGLTVTLDDSAQSYNVLNAEGKAPEHTKP